MEWKETSLINVFRAAEWNTSVFRKEGKEGIYEVRTITQIKPQYVGKDF